MERQKKIHLLWRAGFGPDIPTLAHIEHTTIDNLWKIIKANSQKSLNPIISQSSFVKDNYNKSTDSSLSKNEKEEFNRSLRQQSAKDLRQMNAFWIDNMVNSTNQLGEKMSFFWHHHFAIRHNNSFLQEEAINIIRKYALGSFKDLLREVSKSGAMILSLNNQQNRKSSPNENFAREIMELFSMGIGTYTEKDIKEAARSFTGWSINRKGYFTFRGEQHDTGKKQFLGKTGNFDGDDIIDIILDQPQTATFIVSKVYRFLVHDKIDAKKIDRLASIFRKDYNILNLLESIFTADWFYNEQFIGSRIKTPIELIVGARRCSPVMDMEDNLQYNIQKLLGQILFYPPSIAGWPMEKNWIDNSTLLVRIQFPFMMSGQRKNNFKAKADDDVDMGMTNNQRENLASNKNTVFNPNWSDWVKNRTIKEIAQYLLAKHSSAEGIEIIASQQFTDKTPAIYGIMGLPEYQLC